MKLYKNYLQATLRRWAILPIGLLILFSIYGSLSLLTYAAGSGTLYPNGATGYRANLEWRNSFYANLLRRRALLKVYAQAGEVILLGSSAISVTGSPNNGDIRVYDPGKITGTVGDETIGAYDFSCVDQRAATFNPDQGRIGSRVQELDGPDTIINFATAARGNDFPNGYVPCFYTAPVDGIYHVVFWGPNGNSIPDPPLAPVPTGDIPDNPANFDYRQNASISSWDVTVRSSLTSVTDIPGRLFASYLAFYTGNNPRPVNSTFYVLTTDGYIYQTDLRELDPNGYIIYANNIGFLNTDSTPLYRDILGPNDQLNPPDGGVSIALPTHLIFLEYPSIEAVQANSIPLAPISPQVNSFSFEGNLGGNDTVVGAGGTFIYDSNVSGSHEIIISRNGIDFDPTNPFNRVLRGIRPSGVQTIAWDGLDNAGNPFPTGINYPISITVRAGEYHFPLLDVENSMVGGPQYTLLNPPGGNCPSFYGSTPNCNIAFYDDRGYTTTTGIAIGTPGATLNGNGPPIQNRSDPLQGFNTTTNQRAFGDNGNNGFGNRKGLDLWTYYPSQPQGTVLNIYAFNLQLTKTDGGITVSPGGNITYTLAYTNTGPADATGVVITETVPNNSTFNQAASLPTTWSCANGSPAGTLCTTTLSTVNGGTNGSVTFAVTVDSPLSGVGQIRNSAIIGDDGTHGPEFPDDNETTEETPTTLAIVDPIITKQNTPAQANPGDPVYFSITVLNPAPPSTASATNVILTDPLPLELDLVNYSANPPALVSNVVLSQATVSTIGHPSGVTQTVASTITVYINTLGLNESVTLAVTATVNDLASPPPVNVTNIATLEFDQGLSKQATGAVNVPPPGSGSRSGSGGSGGNKDDDDPPPPSAPPPSAAPPEQTLPVLFLPETGIIQPETMDQTGGRDFIVPLFGMVGLTILYFWRQAGKRS